MAKRWWLCCCVRKASFIRCDQVEGFSTWIVERMQSFTSGYLVQVITTILYAASTCILAIGGAAVGTMVGAMKGQTTETGFLRGAGIGAIAGAITAVQFSDSISDHDEPLSTVALFYSLMNGKVFMEWASPALLKAYQWQISSIESTYREISDIYDTHGNNRGLSTVFIQKLPRFTFRHDNDLHLHFHDSCCSICLQDFKDGELMRTLPNCEHFFHLDCLDEWLSINGSCPICRNNISDD